MSSNSIPISTVLDRLSAGERLLGLPTLRGNGLYFVHHEGEYVWFSLDGSGRYASGHLRMTRSEAEAYLRRYQRGEGYAPELLVAWGESETPSPSVVRAALSQQHRVLGQLRAEPESMVRVMDTRWMWRSPWFGWVTCGARDDAPPSMFVCDDSRAASELLTMTLADASHAPSTPPAELAAFIQTFRAEAAARVQTIGPALGRITWVGEYQGERRGLTKDARGSFVELGMEGEDPLPRLKFYRKIPTAKGHEALFDAFERNGLVAGCLEPDEGLSQMLRGAAELQVLAQWLERREVNVSCGERRYDSWVADTASTMLEAYSGERRPLEEALRPFVEGDGWYQVQFEPFVPLSEVARADDDPNAPAVRYTIPKGWAYEFERRKLVEAALTAVLREATGYEGPLERTQTDDPSDPEHRGRARPRTIVLDGGDVSVKLREYPIEGPHGVHGENVQVSFSGLPEGIAVRAQVDLDMRFGGKIHLDFDADVAVAMQLKQACLAVLP